MYPLLIILITHITLCAAIWCFDERSERAPEPHHCYHILTHLPEVNHDPLTNPYLNDTTPVDSSSPYTPTARFLHRSCFIGIDVRDHAMRMRLPIGLTRLNTMEAWQLVRETVANITLQCVEHSRMGRGVGRLKGTMRPYYRVLVSRPVEDLIKWQAYQRQGFARLDSSPRPPGQSTYRWTPFYVIH